jgi:hypothetical protein
MKSNQADVIIVGGGISGIIVALELLDKGMSICLLDRDVKENFGGLAKESFGGMFFVDTPEQRKAGIKDSPEQAYSDWISTGDFGSEDILPKAWAKQFVYNCTEHIYHWLKSKKIGFFPVVHWVERGMFKPGNTFPRFHMVWGTGYELSRVMTNQLLNHPKAADKLQLKFGHKVEDLVVSGDRVTGVIGVDESNGENFQYNSDITVVATGGIGGSIEKVRENWYKPWGAPPETILTGAHQYGTGILHDAVTKHNGNVTHLDWMWPYAAGVKHPKPKKPNHGLSLVPPKSALWLNYRGERIGPVPLITAYDTRFLVEQICKQEKKYSWQVLNLKIAHKEFAISGSEHNEAIREKNYVKFIKTILFGNKPLVKDMMDNCEDFVIANSIEELVEKMNNLVGNDDVQLEALKAAIENYDGQIDRGRKYFNDEQLRRIAHARQYRGDKVRTCKFQKINDKGALPLIAIREHIISRKTLGGIQTDLKSRVLDKSGQPMDGLYAVGEAAGFGGGGMHGKGALEGTFLGGCVMTARVAAHDIAGKSLIGDSY